MSAAIRRGWRKRREPWPFSRVLAALRAAGCACKPWMNLRVAGKPVGVMPKISSDFFETIVFEPVRHRPRPRFASHRCDGCGTRIVES